MTRTVNGDIVKLSGTNWLGLLATVGTTLVSQAWLFNARVLTLEANADNQKAQMTTMDARIDTARREIMEELRGIRQEMKKQ